MVFTPSGMFAFDCLCACSGLRHYKVKQFANSAWFALGHQWRCHQEEGTARKKQRILPVKNSCTAHVVHTWAQFGGVHGGGVPHFLRWGI